jgi:tRNA threonylcarbamoyladenosine biosynthesis protein TsaE
VRGACRSLGVTAPVTSPTFTIGHRYEGRVPVSHLDLYRFTNLSHAEWGDLEPYFDDAVAFVEWPEAGVGVLPAARVRVHLRHRGRDRRTIRIDGADPGV